jgi:hypothetical protein
MISPVGQLRCCSMWLISLAVVEVEAITKDDESLVGVWGDLD